MTIPAAPLPETRRDGELNCPGAPWYGDIMASSCQGHNGTGGDKFEMPSLFRLLTVLGLIGGMVAGTLYILAVYFEPVPREIAKPISGVKIQRP